MAHFVIVRCAKAGPRVPVMQEGPNDVLPVRGGGGLAIGQDTKQQRGLTRCSKGAPVRLLRV